MLLSPAAWDLQSKRPKVRIRYKKAACKKLAFLLMLFL